MFTALVKVLLIQFAIQKAIQSVNVLQNVATASGVLC